MLRRVQIEVSVLGQRVRETGLTAPMRSPALPLGVSSRDL